MKKELCVLCDKPIKVEDGKYYKMEITELSEYAFEFNMKEIK